MARSRLPGKDGFALVVATVIALLAGYVLDRSLGTAPWLVLVCLTVGIVAGLFVVFRR